MILRKNNLIVIGNEMFGNIHKTSNDDEAFYYSYVICLLFFVNNLLRRELILKKAGGYHTIFKHSSDYMIYQY